MAIIDIPFGGLNTEVDPKLLPQGNTLKLENGYFNRIGEIRKRGGHSTLTGVPALTSSQGLYTRETDLCMIGADSVPPATNNSTRDLFVYGNDNGWKRRGTTSNIEMSASEIGSSNADTASSSDCAINSTSLCFLYTDSSGKHLLIKDTSTESILFSSNSDSSGLPFLGERVLPISTKFAIYGKDGTNIKYSHVNSATNPTSITNGTNITGITVGGSDIWDACAISDSLHAIAYTTATHLVVKTIDASGTVVNTYSDNTYYPDILSITATSDAVYVFYYDASSSGVACVVLTTLMAESVSPFLAHSDGVADFDGNISIFNLVSCIGEDDVGVYFLGGQVSSEQDLLYIVKIDGDGFVTGPTLVSKKLAPYSKPFLYLDDVCIIAYHSDGVENYEVTNSCRYLINEHGQFLYRISSNSSQDALAMEGLCPSVISINSSEFRTILYESRGNFFTINTNGNALSRSDVLDLKIEFNVFNPKAVEANGLLYLCGGPFSVFDGVDCVSAGPLFPPDKFALSETGTGSINAGTFNVVIHYTWTDSKGNIFRSTVSNPKTITVVGSSKTIQVDYIPPTIDKKYGSLLTEVYRTLVDGTLYYKAATVEVDPDSDTITLNAITLSASDDDISGNPFVYTDTGELDSVLPPTPVDLTIDNDKMFLLPALDRKAIWQSKPILENYGVEFSDELIIRLPLAENIEAIESFNGYKIVFTKNQVWYFSGEGPDEKGNGSFSPLRDISKNIGCRERKSVVRIPEGIIFQSWAGFYLLRSDLSLINIGGPIDQDYKNSTVFFAVHIPDLRQVRFGTTSEVLVYQYNRNAWSVYQNGTEPWSAIDWVDINDNRKFIMSVNTAQFYEDASFTDFVDQNDDTVQLAVRTPWIKISALSGFQRVRRVMLLATLRSINTVITIKTYVNYDDTTVSETLTFDNTDTFQTVVGDPVIFSKKLTKQKCQSIMFEITEVSAGGTKEGVSLTGLSIEVEDKDTMTKLPDSQKG